MGKSNQPCVRVWLDGNGSMVLRRAVLVCRPCLMLLSLWDGLFQRLSHSLPVVRYRQTFVQPRFRGLAQWRLTT